MEDSAPRAPSVDHIIVIAPLRDPFDQFAIYLLGSLTLVRWPQQGGLHDVVPPSLSWPDLILQDVSPDGYRRWRNTTTVPGHAPPWSVNPIKKRSHAAWRIKSIVHQPITSTFFAYLMVTHSTTPRRGTPPPGPENLATWRPPTHQWESGHPGRGWSNFGRGCWSSSWEMGRELVPGKSPPPWAPPPVGSPMPWATLGTKGEGGTGGGGGTPWMTPDPPPPSMSILVPGLLSTFRDMLVAEVISAPITTKLKNW